MTRARNLEFIRIHEGCFESGNHMSHEQSLKLVVHLYYARVSEKVMRLPLTLNQNDTRLL
jgi:hypothetical protein